MSLNEPSSILIVNLLFVCCFWVKLLRFYPLKCKYFLLSFLLHESKLNVFVLWTKQDTPSWAKHFRIFRHFMTFYRPNNSSNDRENKQQWKYVLLHLSVSLLSKPKQRRFTHQAWFSSGGYQHSRSMRFDYMFIASLSFPTFHISCIFITHTLQYSIY